MIRVAVVIPYFQRDSGILTRALQSIAAQRFTCDVALRVVVVDDQSPHPPEPECARVAFGDQVDLAIIKRPNGGPGAARNSGLDASMGQTDFVALLDSDDTWQPGHLQHAIDSLGTDCDFYFCDHVPSGMTQSYFESLRDEAGRHGTVLDGLTRGRAVACADDDRQIYLGGKAATLALIRRYLAHTSTIVFRQETLGDIRFFQTLRFAGEDYLFTLQLARQARKTCCSQWAGVRRGRGIDLYMGSLGWNHPDNPKLILDNLKCFIIARTLLGEDRDMREAIVNRIRLYRTEFLWVVLRKILLFGTFDRRIMESAYREDSTILRVAPGLMLKACMAKLRGRPLIDLH